MLYNATNRPLQTIVNSNRFSENQFTSSNIYEIIPYKVEYPIHLQNKVPTEWNPFTNSQS